MSEKKQRTTTDMAALGRKGGAAPRKKERWFSTLAKRIIRKIAKKGGTAAHTSGRAHKFTPKQRSEGGKKGGKKTSEDRELMAKIGRKGGLARAAKAAKKRKKEMKRKKTQG